MTFRKTFGAAAMLYVGPSGGAEARYVETVALAEEFPLLRPGRRGGRRAPCARRSGGLPCCSCRAFMTGVKTREPKVFVIAVPGSAG